MPSIGRKSFAVCVSALTVAAGVALFSNAFAETVASNAPVTATTTPTTASASASAATPADHKKMLMQYCTACHNDRLKTAGMSVVPLDANNRILVHQGLARIRAGRARPGLRALLEVAGRDARRITSTDLGFILGPRLNAAGRLDDMSLGIECLLCEDEALARDMAVQLDQLNQDRKAVEQCMQREALAQLKELPVEEMPFGLCLFDPDWHQGVIGILASRLKERYHRPTIAFADAGDRTLVTTVVQYDSPEDVQKAIDMGLKDGLASTLGRLDELLEVIAAPAAQA